MSRARPRALQHLKEEDASFWESDSERRPPPLLDLDEAKKYNRKPLNLPVLEEVDARLSLEQYQKPYNVRKPQRRGM